MNIILWIAWGLITLYMAYDVQVRKIRSVDILGESKAAAQRAFYFPQRYVFAYGVVGIFTLLVKPFSTYLFVLYLASLGMCTYAIWRNILLLRRRSEPFLRE
ncbi:hypothetical protein KBC99_02270 [Candidatus Saccharibacteria bacterium]|nr:hypothetical protein [Candidatus Saccharibacteria bacterium]